ncbi:cytochrome P450 [Pestalotiopsis sp. NC0098]|nr:cytochrome P450 [Pestalotiopsis sp. NC0098]
MENHFVYLIIFAVSLALHRFILHPLVISPLAKIPSAHWSSSLSSVWLYWMKWTGRENQTVYQAHLAKGPLIQLAPGLLSVKSIDDGLKTVYLGGFPKPPFYFHDFAVYGKGNLFTIVDNATHSAQKKFMTHAFSKSNVLGSQSARIATRDVLFDRVLPKLHEAALGSRPIEIIEFNYSYYLDTFVQWQFGHSLRSNLVENEKERRLYLDGFFGPAGFTFWQYYFPNLSANLRRIGIYIIPKWVDTGFAEVEKWNLDKCDKAQELLASGQDLAIENQLPLFEKVLKGMSRVDAKPKEYPNRLEVASDMFSLNSGAFETSGNTTTYLFYEMCRKPQWQTRLREELLTLKVPPIYVPGTRLDPDDITDPRDLEELPILQAIIMETLRLWPSVPGGQPRVVPKTTSLGGYHNIPAGTVVQAYASVLHREPEGFPDPFAWKPERWLESSKEELTVMKRWFWGFGSGGRMCIGSHFAYYSIKFLVSSVYANFTTTIHDHGDMEPNDGYLAGPKVHRLEISFHRIHDE